MKKILCFVLCIILASLLFSCKKKEEEKLPDDGGGEALSTEFSIVYDIAGVDSDLITEIFNKLYDVTGELPTLKSTPRKSREYP